MFQTVYFYHFSGRQNHCPKSKCYHRGNMREPSVCRWTVTDGLIKFDGIRDMIRLHRLKYNLILFIYSQGPFNQWDSISHLSG